MAATHRGDKRREERVCTALPVNLGNATGTTRNVSASGMFFETDAACTRGGAISVAVEFDTPGGKMKLNCEGRIVRVEPRDPRVGVAVKIVESKMEPVK